MSIYGSMFKTLSFILCLLVPAFISASNPHEHKMVARGAKLVKLAGGFGFTEGPIADNTGNVILLISQTIKFLFGKQMAN